MALEPNVRGLAVRTDQQEEPTPILPNMDEPTKLRFRTALEALVSKLENEATAQRGRRQTIEDRWYTDLRNYYGKYDAETESALKAANKSRLFVKLTRMKTNGWESRLADMLFPTDDKNWGIKPTPVPELNEPMRSGDPQQRQAAEQQVDEAKRRAELMEAEIDDQFKESDYNIQCRDALHDGCKLGTGIIKGPTVTNRTRRMWKAHTGPDGNTLHELAHVEDARPEYKRVNPWFFYPDMSATCLEEAEFTFELHLDTRKDLRKLARNPNVDKAAIRRLLKAGPSGGAPPYIARLRQITNAGETALQDRYWHWEYHGAIETEEMRALFVAMGDEEGLQQMELDPLDEYKVIIHFCQGEVIQFGPHPMDSGDHLYSVWNFEKDDTSVFGMGVPYLMRDSQDSLNGAWRMMMDNGALSAGPQVIIDKTRVEPADGKWNLTPRKVWHIVQNAVASRTPAFETKDIPNNQRELAAIVDLSRQFADDETNFPRVAQGESGSHQTTTAQGMAMLMNSVNVIFRRGVRNFDDDMTTPNVQRAYDWNMQFNPRQEIKGDFEVSARGSSVLLVRDIQAQNLMVMALQFTQNQVLAPLIKILPMLRKLVQANMLPADELVKTEEEVRADNEKAKENREPSEFELELQAKIQVAQMENDVKIAIETMKRDTELMKLAQTHNMKLDELRAMLFRAEKDRESKERIFAAEVGVKNRWGEGI